MDLQLHTPVLRLGFSYCDCCGAVKAVHHRLRTQWH